KSRAKLPRTSLDWPSLWKTRATSRRESRSSSCAVSSRCSQRTLACFRLPKQIAAVRDLVTTDGGVYNAWSVERVGKAFKGARKKEIESVLDSLTARGGQKSKRLNASQGSLSYAA